MSSWDMFTFSSSMTALQQRRWKFSSDRTNYTSESSKKKKKKMNYVICKSEKNSISCFFSLLFFQEKLGYRQVLKPGNNGRHCLCSNRQSWGNGWVLGKKKRGKRAARLEERVGEGEEGEGQHVKAGSVLSERHVLGQGVWVTETVQRHCVTHTGGGCSAPHIPIHTHTNPSIKVMRARPPTV